jgi:type I restriction enzyme M protein
MFHGFDFDATMLRIGAMNMTLHGVENPMSATATASPRITCRRRDLLPGPGQSALCRIARLRDHGQRPAKIVKTKKTELLFLALFLRLLKPGAGRR